MSRARSEQAKADFFGQTALITGAASGIGRLMALAFAREGARVIVVDLNGEGAAEVASEISNRGGEAWSFQADLSDPAAITRLKSAVTTDAGPIDILVNNAGIVFGGSFESVPLERHLKTMRVNSEAMITMTYAFFDDLTRSRDAHIVNIASAAGYLGVPFGTSYAASKWAAIGFSESLRQEFIECGRENIAVTTVCPGYIATGMFDGVRSPMLGKPMTPTFIVEKIMEGVKLRQPFVKEPFIVKTTDVLRAVLPLNWQIRTSQLLGLSDSMRSWKGH